jgi:hypothetical protein
VIIYLWTAPGTDAAVFHRATGVSDDQARACHAAEVLLMTGQACAAYVECAYTAIAASTLSLIYVPTGTGWCAQLGPGGQVSWTPYAQASGSAPASRNHALLTEAVAGA